MEKWRKRREKLYDWEKNVDIQLENLYEEVSEKGEKEKKDVFFMFLIILIRQVVWIECTTSNDDKAFEEIGYSVDCVMGYGKDRKKTN